MTITAFVPPLAQQLVDRFGLKPTLVHVPPAGERPVHTSTVHRLWAGTAAAAGVDDGYNFMEVVGQEFGLRPNPNFGDWPMVVEFFRVHDPKDDGPENVERLFQFIRLTYIEGGVFVALYTNKTDLLADAWRNEENDDA